MQSSSGLPRLVLAVVLGISILQGVPDDGPFVHVVAVWPSTNVSMSAIQNMTSTIASLCPAGTTVDLSATSDNDASSSAMYQVTPPDDASVSGLALHLQSSLSAIGNVQVQVSVLFACHGQVFPTEQQSPCVKLVTPGTKSQSTTIIVVCAIALVILYATQCAFRRLMNRNAAANGPVFDHSAQDKALGPIEPSAALELDDVSAAHDVDLLDK
ncbi:ZP domain-containing protein [Plasmodiophora brassicae]|uniref:ZP domain-containing protein n=1 Tax=Plasmodiophora brassicae TaxID=37360 RepID=A0A0G4IMC6_PLABS|nr:hypothetical protein PBRA_004999 [Plasmodiophora brassicae]SPQ99267.1 unnamed protein product [Plasmodiophora brassicae]